MALLARWKWDNYVVDIRPGEPLPYHFNSDQPGLHSSLSLGDNLWLFGDSQGRRGREGWVLLARLHIAAKRHNKPGDPAYKYGKLGVVGDPERSDYFSPGGPDMTEVVMDLRFMSGKRISDPKKIGNACQALRPLTPEDEELLEEWANSLATIDAAR